MPDSTGLATMMVIVAISIMMGITVTVVLVVLPFWLICKKAGFAGPLALLMLVPVANLVLPFYIAFANWPALRPRDYRPVQPS